MNEPSDFFDRLMDQCSSDAIRDGGLVLSALVAKDEEIFPTIGIGICALISAIANIAVISMPEEADAGLPPRLMDLLIQEIRHNRAIIKKAKAQGRYFYGE
jgi:hypothetical protein